ncbi:MAG: glucosamine-6-phosphate deaminase [Deltaproteobacteria bacterium]|nr:glucosamine-6-phosphate deaminase [Deltaproteobacteria bacterium]
MKYILDSGFRRNDEAGRNDVSKIFNLGLASGSTPKKTYAALAKLVKERGLNLSKLHCFHLDEYVGLSSKDPRSFVFCLYNDVVDSLGLKKEQVTFWRGEAPNRPEECRRYQEDIRRHGGIDCQILGLGINGHIGFNEPGSLKESRCRVVKLTEETLQHNAKDLQGGLMPTQALTMGIADILDAKTILLLVSGKNKTESLRRFLEEKESPAYPASFLKGHKNLTVIADQDAVNGLEVDVIANPFRGEAISR